MIRHLKELEEVLKKNKLHKNDIIIVGSAVLENKQIKKARDLDIILKPEQRKKICNRKTATKLSTNIEVVSENFGKVFNITDEELFRNQKYYDNIKNFKIIKLEVQFAKIIFSYRNKDRDHFEKTQEFITRTQNFDWDLFKEIMFNAKKKPNNNFF